MEKRILGIDPSLTAGGWCLLKNHKTLDLLAGVIRSKDMDDFCSRWLSLVTEMAPDVIFCEQALPFIKVYGKRALIEGMTTVNSSQLVLSEVQGALRMLARTKNIPFHTINVKTWRAAVLGNGNMAKEAAKWEARQYCSRLLKDAAPRAEDACEAVCIALYGGSQSRLL